MCRIGKHSKIVLTGILFPIVLFTVGRIYSCSPVKFHGRHSVVIRGQLLSTYGMNGEHRGEPIAGATVLLTQLGRDGFLHPVTGHTVTTDARGAFTFNSPVHDVRGMVIVAEKKAEEWRAVIDTIPGNDLETDVIPVSYETTVATDLYLSLIKTQHSENASYSSILESIQAELAVMGYAQGGAVTRGTTEIEQILRTPVARPDHDRIDTVRE